MGDPFKGSPNYDNRKKPMPLPGIVVMKRGRERGQAERRGMRIANIGLIQTETLIQ